MPIKNIVIGQKVTSAKVQRSHELRHEMTRAETILWQQLRCNQLGDFHFRRQQIIDGFIVDFYCHAASLIVELDGEIHLQQTEKDQERDRILANRGFQVLRFRNQEVDYDLEHVLTLIRDTCVKRTASL